MNAYLCVTIDCECDKGPGWRTQKPLAFSGMWEGISNRLHPLFRKFGAKPTYLLSPEVMRDERALDSLRSIGTDAELGTHLHGEFSEPGDFVPDVTDQFQRDYDRSTEEQKLNSLTVLFKSAFGKPARSFRAGRFGIGANSLSLLAGLGYAVDSSVTPHMDWTRSGAPGLSFKSAPTQPYWPELDSPGQVAARRTSILEVPVTIQPSRFAWIPVAKRWLEPRWLRPTHGNLGKLIDVARSEIVAGQDSAKPTILNCMFHNVEIVPGASPYAQDEAKASAILHRLAGLLEYAERHAIRTIGLTDVAEMFESPTWTDQRNSRAEKQA